MIKLMPLRYERDHTIYVTVKEFRYAIRQLRDSMQLFHVRNHGKSYFYKRDSIKLRTTE